jgi:hypothetical protein
MEVLRGGLIILGSTAVVYFVMWLLLLTGAVPSANTWADEERDQSLD